MPRRFLFLMCLGAVATVAVFAQTPPPTAVPTTQPASGGRGRRSFDPAAIERAKAVYVPLCGSCHGADARGATQGSDLARSLLVYNDQNGKEIGALLRAGVVEKNMPAFPNLTDAQIADIAVFLHERVEAARSSAVTEAARQLVGNASAGEAFFNGAGRCSTCHSATGDLRGIGGKYDVIALQDRFVNPRGVRGRGGDASPRSQRSATVTPPGGSAVTGQLLSISEFAVTLVDAAGHRRTFTRNGDIPKVVVVDPLQAHFDLLRTYKDSDIHNLTAYLVTLK